MECDSRRNTENGPMINEIGEPSTEDSDLAYARRIQQEELNARLEQQEGTTLAPNQEQGETHNDLEATDAQLARVLQEDEVAEYRTSSRGASPRRRNHRVRASVPGAVHVSPHPSRQRQRIQGSSEGTSTSSAIAQSSAYVVSRRSSQDAAPRGRWSASVDNACATTSVSHPSERYNRELGLGAISMLSTPSTSLDNSTERRFDHNVPILTGTTSRLSSNPSSSSYSSSPARKTLAKSCHGAPQDNKRHTGESRHPGDVSLMDAIPRQPLSKSCHGTESARIMLSKSSAEKQEKGGMKKMLKYLKLKKSKKEESEIVEPKKQKVKKKTTSIGEDNETPVKKGSDIEEAKKQKGKKNTASIGQGSEETVQQPTTSQGESTAVSAEVKPVALSGARLHPVADESCTSTCSEGTMQSCSVLVESATAETVQNQTDACCSETKGDSTSCEEPSRVKVNGIESASTPTSMRDSNINENETDDASSKGSSQRRTKRTSRLNNKNPTSTRSNKDHTTLKKGSDEVRKTRLRHDATSGTARRGSNEVPSTHGNASTTLDKVTSESKRISVRRKTIPQVQNFPEVNTEGKRSSTGAVTFATSTTSNNKKNASRHLDDAIVCCVCKGSAERQSIFALEKIYHRECFRCFACHEKLDSNEPFTFTTSDDGTTHPMHKSCHIELFGMKCTICQNSIPRDPINGKVSYTKHPFFSNEVMCPTHADTVRRCTGCHRFEPIVGTGFLDLTDGDRCLCLSCVRSVVLDNDDAKPIWHKVLTFLEESLGLPLWEGMNDIPILIVGQDTLSDNTQSQCSAHSGSSHLMTRGLCLTEHQGGTRINLMSQMKFNPLNDSFTRRGEESYFVIPEVNTSRGNSTSNVIAILCLAGLPDQLTASILAHEAIHAWIKMHPHYVYEKPISARVEEGVCQLVAYLYLNHLNENEGNRTTNHKTEKDMGDSEEPPSSFSSSSAAAAAAAVAGGEPSDEKLRQYFKFSIETDNNEIYGDGFRDASKAYSALGIEPLLSHIVRYRNFPDV